jgi:trans-2,3-dihydro-3-hydroxyanthranilate isomerase
VLEYEVVDVFTDTAFAGNPLAVVLGAEDLDTAALQAIANEFNLSETAFPMDVTAPEYRLRIFTPEMELPFAGHPSVGAAWVLLQRGLLQPGAVVQDCGAGRLALEVGPDLVTLTGGAPTCSEPLDAAPVLRAVGLLPEDLVGVQPRVCGTGLDWTYLVVRREALERCAPDIAALKRVGGAGISVLAWEDGRAQARVFAGGVGVAEDPATGSAALGLGVYLVATGLLPDGGPYEVRQGLEMGRPSTLTCSVVADAGRAVSVQVGGGVVPVATGRIRRPLEQ